MQQLIESEDFEWQNTPEYMEMFETVINNDEHYELLKILVRNGAPYLYSEDSKGNRKETVVEKCMKRNDYYFFSELVGINWNNPDLNEEIELEWQKQLGRAVEAAAEANDVKTAELLQMENASGFSTFELAARGGWKYIKVFGADFDEWDAHENTMLHHAAMNGKTSTIKYLIENGAWLDSINSDARMPLHLAALFQADNDLTLKLLIENSDISYRDTNGVTITQILAKKGKYHFIQRLMELGANPDDQDNNGNYTFIEAAKNGHTLTVKELFVGGAIIAMEDKNRMSALDHAMENQKDETSALLIRLDTRKDYMDFFNRKYEMSDHNIEKLIKMKQKKTIVALLDRSLNCDYEWEEYKKISLDLNAWGKGKILERFSKWGDEELAYHGTIRKLIDSKMWKFGYKILSMKILFFILFLLTLSYSLVQASTAGIPRDTYTEGLWSIVRILSDLFVLGYFFYNVSTECIEVFRIMRNTHEYLQSKTARRVKVENKVYENLNEREGDKSTRSLKSKLYNIFCIRVVVDYFSDLSNAFDTLGLSSLLLLVILRVARQPVQWVFATLTFFLNAARIFKFIVLIPRLGPYSTIIYRILIKDVPLFSSLFAITLFIFTGGYFISLRTPYSSQGFSNASLVQNIERTPGVDDRVQWVFLSGLRLLLEGNVYETNYLYNQLNWLAASIYLTFLFLTVVVFLNVFIAQLSDRYAEVKEKANQLFALQKLNFIVQVETTSVLSCFIDFKERYKMGEKSITPEEMLIYYNFPDPASLNETAINAVKPTKHYPQIPTFNVKKPESHPSYDMVHESDQIMCSALETQMREIDRTIEKTNSSVDQVNTIESMIENLRNIIDTEFDKLSSV